MSDILVLVGEAGVGKTTIEEKLNKLGVYRLISHTSRPKRIGEAEGREYYFRDKKYLKDLINEGNSVEYTSYVVNGENWYYALSKEEIEYADKYDTSVVTINPHGISQLLTEEWLLKRLKIVRVKVPLTERIERYLDREKWDKQAMINLGQRIERDVIDFDYFDNELVKEIQRLGIRYVEYNNSDEVSYEDKLKNLKGLLE